MRYLISIVAKVRGNIKNITWSNGGVGYTEQELIEHVIPKIEADSRIVSYNVTKKGE